MKILQILPELNVGGVETGTVDFAKYLKDHGHDPLVVSNGGALVAILEEQGIKHVTLPVHRKSLWIGMSCLRQLRKIILEEKVDLVHARSRVPAWIAFFACRQTPAVFLTTCHGYYAQHFFSRVMGWGKLVIVPSKVIGRHMIDHFDVPSENVRHIPRSVDLQRFSFSAMPQNVQERDPTLQGVVPPAKSPGGKGQDFQQGHPVLKEAAGNLRNFTVAIIGRITPLKGHAYFFQAMAQVARQIPTLKVLVIGDFPPGKDAYREELQVLLKRLGLSLRVDFLGTRRDLPELLKNIDVVVLATVTEEAFGRVILESQAVGVPVVATRVGGVTEIIEHEKTGLLVAPKDPAAMAAAVLRLQQNPDLAHNLILAARGKVETEFTLDRMAAATLKVYQEALRSQKILIIKLSSLGDVILISAALKAIREKFPKARIYCLTSPESCEILRACPYLDELLVYDRKDRDRGFQGLLKIGRKLRRERFDRVIDLQNNRQSHLLAFLSFSGESYGYDNGKFGGLLSRKIKSDLSLPAVEHQFQILKMLGISYDANRMALGLWPAADDEDYVARLFDSNWLGNNKNIIGINIAASRNWATKNWPLKNLAQLCDLLAAKSFRVVITGQEKDQEAVRELLTRAKSKPAILIGKTSLLQLACVIKRCLVFISPDSAPLHVAAAVGVPFVALFGPTNPARHLPPASRFSVLKKDLSCAPCYSQRCRILTHACMNKISAEEVWREVEKLLIPQAAP